MVLQAAITILVTALSANIFGLVFSVLRFEAWYMTCHFSLFALAYTLNASTFIYHIKKVKSLGISFPIIWTVKLLMIVMAIVIDLISERVNSLLFGAHVLHGFLLVILFLFSFWIKHIEKYRYRYESVNGDEAQVRNLIDRPVASKMTFKDKLKKTLPFVWPRNSLKLQIMVLISFGCLIIGRIVNVYVPVQFKNVIDSLTQSANTFNVPWMTIIIYVVFRFFQSGVGLIAVLQNLLWIRVGQYTTKSISVEMFSHLHSLSLQFHLNRKTGEVLRVMDRGTASIVSLLNSILFNIFPTLVDITVALLFFIITFDGWFGLIVLLTMGSYICMTVLITEWRTKFRKTMNELENKTSQRAVDSLLNFETVKYYGAEKYEVEMYSNSIQEYQHADWLSQASLQVLNSSQNCVITLGLLAGSLLCANQVANGERTIGDFILFMTYITQLYAPLNFFGTYYRVIQQNFIDMEKMLALFEEKAEIVDKSNAKPLNVTNGHVIFDNVSFSYDGIVPAIQNLNFEIPPGQTVALVGTSGSGKSTILRLLFRFYDVQKGSITIDGCNIKDITAQSLRQSIGVVPQDTVLFNDTIKYNIRYGRISATDEEIEKAAEAAQIHTKILTFPEKYETRVGERGLRLSGGEKQRVAIARTILKNPSIVVLDEATSALDTTTERSIQSALRRITENRTTLIIAHRLSTIIHADKIIVLEKGSILEQGSHKDLLNKKGIYHEMWMKQMEAS
ncbi:P-loop containing nucleoside triphosphate hydrolase protein, partial [Rozella allomycis CSF55]